MEIIRSGSGNAKDPSMNTSSASRDQCRPRDMAYAVAAPISVPATALSPAMITLLAKKRSMTGDIA